MTPVTASGARTPITGARGTPIPPVLTESAFRK
jgi:hypothetical protein